MADATTIAQVRELLGPDAPQSGWDDARIGILLDADLTPDAIAARWWDVRMAATAHLANMSESGSSRSLADIHRNAKEMSKLYRDRVAAASGGTVEGVPPAPVRVFRSHKMKRV